MDIAVKTGAIQTENAELIVVNLFEGVTKPGGATGAVDKAFGGQISRLIADGDFKGKAQETALLYTDRDMPAKRVLIVGLAKRKSLIWRRSASPRLQSPSGCATCALGGSALSSTAAVAAASVWPTQLKQL